MSRLLFDPYNVLSISRNASPEEIKKAYKKACRDNHPDRYGQAGREEQAAAEERFKKIQQAYNIVSSAHYAAPFCGETDSSTYSDFLTQWWTKMVEHSNSQHSLREKFIHAAKAEPATIKDYIRFVDICLDHDDAVEFKVNHVYYGYENWSFVATKDATLPPLYDSMSLNVFVPEGVTIKVKWLEEGPVRSIGTNVLFDMTTGQTQSSYSHHPGAPVYLPEAVFEEMAKLGYAREYVQNDAGAYYTRTTKPKPAARRKKRFFGLF